MLAGEGMSQVVRSLQELLARRTYYSGDLLFSVDILRNVTDTFKRATYVPSADDVQVPLHSGGVCWGGRQAGRLGLPDPALSPQRFFQVVSFMVDSENKDKWDDAQQVRGGTSSLLLPRPKPALGPSPPPVRPQVSPGSVHLLRVVEDFIHLVGDALKAFQSSLIVTDNLGTRRQAREGVLEGLELYLPGLGMALRGASVLFLHLQALFSLHLTPCPVLFCVSSSTPLSPCL